MSAKSLARTQVLENTKAPRKFFTTFKEVAELPHLIELQLDSYKWFFEKGLKELLLEINPIKDFTGKNLEMFFGDYFLDKPKYDEKTAREAFERASGSRSCS